MTKFLNLRVLFRACLLIPLIVATMMTYSQAFEKDVIKTDNDDLVITFIGHGTLMFEYNNQIIHVDPTMHEADYSGLPEADLILITHEHGDHFDKDAIEKILKDETMIIMTRKCSERMEDQQKARVMNNGDEYEWNGLKIKAVPAYNIVHKRPDNNPYHPKGDGNGYILTIGGKHIYVAGDTENTPEMKSLENIDIAFLPMNLPYTMTPEMVADAARALRPEILYPYHFGDTDTQQLIGLLQDEEDIEVRVRKME